jgi:hypothetical protein
MKQAADKKVAEVKSYFDGQPVEGRERTVACHLYNVADAFKSWNIIREEPPAKAYLVTMLQSKERRQSEKRSPEKRPTLMDNPMP